MASNICSQIKHSLTSDKYKLRICLQSTLITFPLTTYTFSTLNFYSASNSNNLRSVVLSIENKGKARSIL